MGPRIFLGLPDQVHQADCPRKPRTSLGPESETHNRNFPSNISTPSAAIRYRSATTPISISHRPFDEKLPARYGSTNRSFLRRAKRQRGRLHRRSLFHLSPKRHLLVAWTTTFFLAARYPTSPQA